MTTMDTPCLQTLLKHLNSQKLKQSNVFYGRQTTVCSNQEEEEEKEESLFHHMSHNVQQSETGTHTRHTRCEHQLCVGSNTLAASFITTTRCCSNTSGYTQLMQLNAHFTF